MDTMQLIRDKYMMCMVRKACHKEEAVVPVLPTSTLPSCQLMTCSNNSLAKILTFLDQQDLTIHSFVRHNLLTKYIQHISNNILADFPRMGRSQGHSVGGFSSFGNDFSDMGFGSFGSGGSAFPSFRY